MKAKNPKPPSARTVMAMAKAQAYQHAADAPSTLRAYASDVKNFEAWYARHSMIALPATPEVVDTYLASAGERYAMQSSADAWRRSPGRPVSPVLRGTPSNR